MATIETWLGTTSGAFLLAANWVSTDTPDTGDSAVFLSQEEPNDSTTYNVEGGNYVASELINFTVQPNCSVKFGERSNLAPAVGSVHLDTDNFYFYGDGLSFFEIDNATLIILEGGTTDSDGAGIELTGDGVSGNTQLVINLDAGNTCWLAVDPNDVFLCDTIRVQEGDVTGGTGIDDAADSAAGPAVVVSGGSLTMSSTVVTLVISGGEYTQVAGKATAITATGGTVYYDSTTAPSGAVALTDCVLDFSGDARTKAWGSVTMTVAGNVTIENPGGRATLPAINPAAGSSLTITT